MAHSSHRWRRHAPGLPAAAAGLFVLVGLARRASASAGPGGAAAGAAWTLPVPRPPQSAGFGVHALGGFLQSNFGNAFGVLVGVGGGQRALELLDSWPQGVLFLVDPYIHVRRGFDRPENVNDNDQQHLYEHLRNVLHDKPGVQGRYSFVREFSFAVPELWRDKQWGPAPRFVFLDGNPSYGAVTADLRAWWPLLSDSGVLGGRNYSTLGDGTAVGVKKAVDEFVRDRGLQLFLTTDPAEPAWLLLKEDASGR